MELRALDRVGVEVRVPFIADILDIGVVGDKLIYPFEFREFHAIGKFGMPPSPVLVHAAAQFEVNHTAWCGHSQTECSVVCGQR